MDAEMVLDLLNKYKGGTIDEKAALEAIKNLSYENLGFAKVDHRRELMSGYPEVIFCEGKTAPQIERIAASILAANTRGLLATRAEPDAYAAILKAAPDAVYHELSRVVTVIREPVPVKGGVICVLSAGTADIRVADEAAITAELLGNKVERIYDVGVAGLHRLLAHTEAINGARVLIVAAGMEGALPSVVGGLTDKPVIAVPTSVGYGAGAGGYAALFAMLNSCAAGVGVMNIDNGFGAGFLASRINRI